eukprot:CAMPEP_0170080662 /NCGR_PEP_ID=MMETSP0019_2-20121128/16745_1 /TAXON_ID=98059 /ORGANISM="Dinobryon sp., Strain UTEXLB2267" /LENGTH=196 /DNA_ID=CAMNT_0010294747 /DNA_START=11 /DNA_END=601 /DNA_ORIENTATION=-
MEQQQDNRPPEFEPPLASVNRVIKSVLPDNILLTKDARAAFARAAGIFIFYITHAANEFSRENKRHTIFTADVLNALKEVGFEDFERPIVEFLEVYRREQAEAKRTTGKAKEADESKSAIRSEGVDEDVDQDVQDDDGDVLSEADGEFVDEAVDANNVLEEMEEDVATPGGVEGLVEEDEAADDQGIIEGEMTVEQ